MELVIISSVQAFSGNRKIQIVAVLGWPIAIFAAYNFLIK